jgi:transposase
MIGMMKRHEIQVLLKAGHTQSEVAQRLGVCERSVRTIAKEAPIETIDDGEGRRRRRIGRPSKAEPFRSAILSVLKEDPALMSLEILRRMREQGYDGRKSAMYRLIASVRPEPVRPMVRFEGVAGEFSQHDFGEVDVRFMNGECRRIHFFASRLKYSRDVRVTLVDDERVESLVRSLVGHFEAWGGVPLLAVFDRPKTVAMSWTLDGNVTEWNATFSAVMLELGVGIELCWPARGNQKGAVENLVGWVKGSFFKVRRFWDEQDLREQLAAWHVEVNTERPSRATGIVPAVRLAEEQARLRPLKVAPQDLALRIPIFVGPTATVLHDTHVYSMPPEAIGINGTLFLYPDRVRIAAGRHESLHPRLWQPGERSILPGHRALMVAAVSGKRAKRYLKRQHLIELGQSALDYITEIVHRRPRAWVGEVDRLHDLLQQHGSDALRQAFDWALTHQLFGAEYISHELHTHAATDPRADEVAR